MAEFSRKVQYQGVPGQLIPRIRGLIRYYTVLNAKQMQEFYCLLKLLNANKIDVMLMKGGAMKAFYVPKSIRHMGDVDFVVKRADFQRACKVIEETGEYVCFIRSHHMTVQRNGQILELHNSFLKENQKRDNEEVFWKEIQETHVQEEKVYVPVPEVLLIQVLTNIFGDVVRGNFYKTHWVRWVVDSVRIIDQNELDWNKIQLYCQKFHVTLAVRTMLEILNDILPGKVDKSILQSLQIGQADARKIPIALKMNKCYVKFMGYRDKNAVLYIMWGIIFHWYDHCYIANHSNWWSDLITFPQYVKGVWGYKTWRECWTMLYQKLRNPKYGDFMF